MRFELLTLRRFAIAAAVVWLAYVCGRAPELWPWLIPIALGWFVGGWNGLHSKSKEGEYLSFQIVSVIIQLAAVVSYCAVFVVVSDAFSDGLYFTEWDIYWPFVITGLIWAAHWFGKELDKRPQPEKEQDSD